ncbi:hypothetical protein [Burkholderia pseudomallei]|uniref:hypothetical protein n=1 Tax=Burkholderia pseudomallei TaxID=28450 RepID=UPI0021F72F02|nr:hypothetical protein [Burkholderia pseudomallei]MCW0101046.1 hypothetical protein [Burkholderia pseudomallei]
MSNRELLTVSAFKARCVANADEMRRNEDHARALMVDALLRHVEVRLSWGLQAACKDAWNCIGRHVPYAHKSLAEKTLADIGWVRKQRGQAE